MSLPDTAACDPFVRRPVRKIFADGARTGTSPDYWDHEWLDVDLTAQVQRATENPPSFESSLSRALIPSNGGLKAVIEVERRRN